MAFPGHGWRRRLLIDALWPPPPGDGGRQLVVRPHNSEPDGPIRAETVAALEGNPHGGCAARTGEMPITARARFMAAGWGAVAACRGARAAARAERPRFEVAGAALGR